MRQEKEGKSGQGSRVNWTGWGWGGYEIPSVVLPGRLS